MQSAQEAATAVNTAASASNASASALAEVKAAAEKAMAAILAAIDAFDEVANLAAVTTEEAESAAFGAIQACTDAVADAERLGSPEPINHTKQAEYEVQTALAHVTAAKENTHSLRGMLVVLKTDLTAPLVQAADHVEANAAGPMQTAAGSLDQASTHLQAIT